ncbi:MAG: sigma-70 family RNA polymerase sigma factor [Verrucomicrobiae bacterium]|nr:sigma-70 family RNA polymerase sigma factor [Verrucomicrobiae bacterium]
MPELSDMELVRDYARRNSEAAFAELVRRQVNLVYSAALRHTGIAAQAEEITQAVFIILARKAAGLREGTVLEAWLFETTRLTALSFLRAERRRQFREQEAYMQSTLQDNAPDPVWHRISPLLDEAMMRLGAKDREAVMLRYFKEQSLRETAAGLNISEAAAQKRVNRALEKLRSFFSKRGVSSTTVIIATTISANSVHAAPAALAKSVSVIAAAKGAAASTSTLTLIKGALKLMAWTKMKIAVVTGAAILLTAGGFTAVETTIHAQTALEGKNVLDKVIAANRYWLLAPPASVTDYSYVYHLDWAKAPGGVVTTPIHINARHKASPNERQGITYSSALQQMARHPQQTRVTSSREENGKLYLTLEFSPVPGAKTSFTADGTTYPLLPLSMECGNGISQNFRGYFATRATTAEVILNATNLQPETVVTKTKGGSVEETFADYTEVTPGNNVPLSVTIKQTGLPAKLGDMIFDWKFKLHDHSLWLLDESNYRGKKVVWIDQVTVNAGL